MEGPDSGKPYSPPLAACDARAAWSFSSLGRPNYIAHYVDRFTGARGIGAVFPFPVFVFVIFFFLFPFFPFPFYFLCIFFIFLSFLYFLCIFSSLYFLFFFFFFHSFLYVSFQIEIVHVVNIIFMIFFLWKKQRLKISFIRNFRSPTFFWVFKIVLT